MACLQMKNEPAWTEAEVMAQIERTHRLARHQDEATMHFAHFGATLHLEIQSKDVNDDLQDAWMSQMAQFDVNENGV